MLIGLKEKKKRDNFGELTGLTEVEVSNQEVDEFAALTRIVSIAAGKERPRSSDRVDYSRLPESDRDKLYQVVEAVCAQASAVNFMPRACCNLDEGRQSLASSDLYLQASWIEFVFQYHRSLIGQLIQRLDSFHTVEDLKDLFYNLRFKSFADQRKKDNWISTIPMLDREEVVILKAFWEKIKKIASEIRQKLPDDFKFRDNDVWKNISLCFNNDLARAYNVY